MNLNIVKYIIMVILLLFIANSCKKSANPTSLDLRGIYVSSNTINLSGVFMYTMHGQVTNQDSIKTYINRHSGFIGNLFIFNSSVTDNNQPSTQVDFTGNGKATSNELLKDSIRASQFTVTQKTSTGFILESVDSSRSLTNNNQSRSSMLMANANLVNTTSDCYSLPFSTGYTESCIYRPALPFIIKNGQIYLSLFSCAIASSFVGNSSGNTVGNSLGSFNTGLIKQLSTGDTLIYQSKTVLFNKK